MEPFYDASVSNASKQCSTLLCQEKFASYEDVVVGSDILFANDDHISINKIRVIQNTIVLKERTLVSLYQSDSVVCQSTMSHSGADGQLSIPQSSADGQLSISKSSTDGQQIIPHSSRVISHQNENQIDEVEMSSQTSFMELCSQESTDKMDACSQESVNSKMDLASQENELEVEDRALVDHEAVNIDEARSTGGNTSYKTDLKRKQVTNSNNGKETDMVRRENASLSEPIEMPQNHAASEIMGHPSSFCGNFKKRFKK